MNIIKHTLVAVGLSVAATAGIAAQDMSHDGMDMSKPMPQGMQMPAADATPADAALTRGVVRKIDVELGKLTIQHEALQNLGMPGMTMVFRAADPALLRSVKVGQAIAFRAERLNGALVVTKLQAQQ